MDTGEYTQKLQDGTVVKHLEANVKIYFTREYTRFKSVKGNRLLNEKKIKKIMDDIQAGFDMLRYCPIIVDKNLNVVDGQHRLYVARKLQSNIWYVIKDEETTLPQIAKMNSNTERWKAKDFLHCFNAQDNVHYEKLQQFMQKYNFPLSVCLKLLYSGTAGAQGGFSETSLFEQGKFEIKEEEKAVAIAELVMKFKDHAGHNKGPFISAIAKLYACQMCDFEELLKKYQKDKDSLPKCSSLKDYLKALEDLYNKYSRERIQIYK